MTKHEETFDLFKGESLKEHGITSASLNKHDELMHARSVAKKIARSRPDRCVHADLVQAELIPLGISLGNAAGALFREKCWVFTGQWVKSARVTNHASVRRVWRLNE